MWFYSQFNLGKSLVSSSHFTTITQNLTLLTTFTTSFHPGNNRTRPVSWQTKCVPTRLHLTSVKPTPINSNSSTQTVLIIRQTDPGRNWMDIHATYNIRRANWNNLPSAHIFLYGGLIKGIQRSSVAWCYMGGKGHLILSTREQILDYCTANKQSDVIRSHDVCAFASQGDFIRLYYHFVV